MERGSGLDGKKGQAVEQLWAALLEGSLTDPEIAKQRRLYDQTHGGAPFAQVVHELNALAARFPLAVASAKRTSPSVNGDVDADLEDGTLVKFEVKAQVKKAAFSDITQSDWVRDQTDLLSRLVQTDPAIRTHFVGFGASELTNVKVDPDWRPPELHLSDIVGLTDGKARSSAGVRKPAELPNFIDSKWFLHVTMQGARLCRYAELAPVRYLLLGGAPNWKTKVNKTGRALLSLGSPTGDTWFTYHLYPSVNVKGRHKLHAAAFEGVAWI